MGNIILDVHGLSITEPTPRVIAGGTSSQAGQPAA